MSKLSRFIVTVVCSLISALSLAETHELSTRGTSIDRIVAVVNDGVVLNSELEEETARIVARLKQQKTELPNMAVLRKQVLERLINQELQMQRANKAGL